MNNEKMNSIFQIAGIIFGLSLFTMASLYFFPLLLLILPVGFVILGVRNGYVEGIISLMTICTIVAYLADPMTALYLFILFAPIIIAMIYTIKSRKSAMEVLLYSTIALFASVIIVYSLISFREGNILVSMEEIFKESLALRLQALKDMGLSSYEILENKNFLQDSYKYMLLIAPATMLVSSLAISYINYSISIMGLKKVGIETVNIPKFSRFRLPNNIAIGIIVMFLTSFIAKQLNFDYFDTIVVNITVLIGFMFLIQGLSIIDFFLIKMKVRKFFRIFFLLLTILIAPLITIVSTLGLIDVIFDLRKLRRKESL